MATPLPAPNRSSVATTDTTSAASVSDCPSRRIGGGAGGPVFDDLFQMLKTDFDVLDNDESGSEASTPNGYYLTSLDDSFGSLQLMGSLMSGTLSKLNLSSGKRDSWNNRHFILMQDGRLFLFKQNPSPQTLPITFLPISKYSSAPNQRQAWIFYLSGDGVTADGAIVKRNWSLKSTDPLTTQLWQHAFATVTSTCAISPTASTFSGGDSVETSKRGSNGSLNFSQGSLPRGTSRLRSSMSPQRYRRALSASQEVDGASNSSTSMQRTKSHGGRPNGLHRGIRDVNVTVRHISIGSTDGMISDTPKSNTEETERRKRYFAMPATATEERTKEIVSEQAETAANAEASDRQKAITQRIAESKKAREPQSTNVLLNRFQGSFKIL
ncbi:hypothetical protein HDU82_001438 [Entophlyctis luteolus]|nr:hypothetical protein HDU82_001438 [Entophlyctis luteolus]